MKRTCAQRGCTFESVKAPKKCPVCKNPYIGNVVIKNPTAADDGEAPWSDYTLAELREYCRAWGVEYTGRVTKAYLIKRLEAAETADSE